MCVLYFMCVYGDGDILCKDPGTPSLGLTVALANSNWWIECRAKQVPVDPWSYLSLLQTSFLLTGSWNTLSPNTSHTGCINIKWVCVCVYVWKRESLDTKLCFQLNNSAPFQQYQGPRGREQKRKQVEGRRKEWRELVAQRTAVIILALLSAECSCHTSMDTELKDECSLPSFSLFLCFLQIYTFLYLFYFSGLSFLPHPVKQITF